MSWILSATGRVEVGLEHLEAELHDALHKVLSDPKWGLLVSHFQSGTVDRMHTVGDAPAPEPVAAQAAAETPVPEAAPAVDPPAETAPVAAETPVEKAG